MASARRSRGPAAIGSLLRGAKELKIPADLDVAPIAFRDWEAAVGTRIAARARPVKLERGVLVVRAASATWSQELSLLSTDIVARLRARGVAVESLRFRVGKVDPPERPPTRDEIRKAPPEAPLPQPLRAELAKVEDDALREAIALAASRQLGWQELARPKPRKTERGVTSTRPAAPAPRSAAAESDRSAHTSRPGSSAPRRKP